MSAKKLAATNAKNERRFLKALLRAFRSTRNAVRVTAIADAASRQDRQQIESLLYAPTRFPSLKVAAAATNLPRLYQVTMLESADAVRYDLKISGSKKGGLTSFNRITPEAVAWAKERSAELVVGLSKESRAAVQRILTRAFSEGWTAKSTARMIREIVGLTERQANAVANLYGRIVTAKPGSLVRAGKIKIRIPKVGMQSDDIDRVVGRYAQNLLNRRALSIARTEIITASSQGQQTLWNEAVKNGELRESDVVRQWSTALDERRCVICAGLHGTTAKLNGLFPGGYSAAPAHPNCRCSVGLRRATAFERMAA